MESWGVGGEKLERAHVVLSTHSLDGAVTPAGATVLVFVAPSTMLPLHLARKQ